MIKYLYLVAACAALTGCAEWTVVKTSVAEHGAAVADQELVTARWATCEAVTVGAIRRRYANDPEGLKAWQAYCSTKQQEAVAP
jgi:hypothetical protein